MISLIATVQSVVATVAPQRINAQAANQGVVACCSSQHDMLATIKFKPGPIGLSITIHIGACSVADNLGMQELQNWIGFKRVGTYLLVLINFKDVVRRLENQARKVRRPCVAQIRVTHDHLGKRVAL